MLIRRLWRLIDDTEIDKGYWQSVADENFSRLRIGSVVILLLEILVISYAALVFNELLYLPILLIPLCSLNIVMWLLATKGIFCKTHSKQALVYFNVLVVLCAGGLWNIVMQGTPQAIPIFMFMVFFVAAAFIIRPKHSLLLFLGSETVFLVSVLRYPSEGLNQPSNVINSILVVILAWTISVMSYRGHQMLYRDKKVIGVLIHIV